MIKDVIERSGRLLTNIQEYIRKIEHWVTSEFAKLNKPVSSIYETIKSSGNEIVLRISAENEVYYFKSVGIAWAFECPLSNYLSVRHPGKTTTIVAVHPTEPWMLMKEVKGNLLRKTKDKKVWQRALQEYAELQVQEVKHAQKLIELGIPDRRIHILKEQIDHHLEDMFQTGLNEEETKTIMEIKPELLEMCEIMDSLIPPSLDHGDLHSANIYEQDGRSVFIDWGDASVTHPFFSTRIFWNSLDELIDNESEWLDMTNEFRPYYLEPWTTFGTMKQLEEMLKVSDQLGCLHRGIGWHLYTLPFQNREEFKNRPAQWLQVLLEYRGLIRNV
ncbi:phosphotransferase [Fredinandcohnia sp. 179-A 10B2 NHS]|uniref:phosphotransferase n=1 Tax=Fredinandcohnia sp. 179-A 10B2 NHS TaxID=3235176 RepID=UPI0039A369F4